MNGIPVIGPATGATLSSESLPETVTATPQTEQSDQAAPAQPSSASGESGQGNGHQPSVSSGGAQQGHDLPGGDFGSISFDFDGGLPDGTVTDGIPDGTADGDHGAGSFESIALLAPPEVMG
ncbi:hypothetical protein ACIPYQ_15230 [Streptomyces sp. NPDC090045]|uniref:hypothetical protein n=1 Tax=Streptomyces sp. NPDC090045 TaxID=3365927 RepID=UPI00381A22B9